MAKSTVLLWVILALSSPRITQACSESEYQDDLARLQLLVPDMSVASPSASSLASFFDALPARFECFNRIFGFDGTPAPLYSTPQLRPLFPKIALVVPPEKYVGKLVALSVNARWEADQTGALQNAVRSSLRAQTNLFVGFVSQQTSESEATVWRFLFSDPHPRPLAHEIQEAVCAAKKRSCELSKQAYSRGSAQELTH